MQNEINVGRLNGILHKLLDMKEGSPSPVLGAEVIPVLVLESDRAEWRWLGGQKHAWGCGETTGAAAQNSKVALINPAGSGALIVCERVIITPENSTLRQFTLRVTFAAADLASFTNLNQAIWRDLRGSSNPGSNLGITGIIGFQATGALTASSQCVRIHGSTSFPNIDLPGIDVVLPPGSALVVQQMIDFDDFVASFLWRERVLEPSEVR